ncbi:TetR/AcrR family transcriptional regulator [Phenylobacterium sp. J426]|uniref:TetR/AcrR family transcriptional regulator n=1 Tax=Phenylobacterium sp. J426 TaxID=2898439 RepID=UPI00215169B4|nr:TetR/AcrR family transcriptional regulator [Phenylobacterium sp. J426]MCR5872763.1 TetR/AcrR family transcriptional regulator [Phenylobacterium sp. J426]
MVERANDIEVQGVASPRRAPTRRFEARRSAIIRSAVAEMNRKGVRGMTLGEVAARLNLVPTGVIYYFKNKEELAQAALLRGLDAFEALVGAGEGAASASEALAAFVRAWFDHRLRLAAGEADDIPVFNDIRALNCPQVDAAFVQLFRRVRDLLASEGSLPRPHANARAHLLLSQMLWAPAWLGQVEPADYGRTAGRMIDILANGFLAGGRGLAHGAAAEPGACRRSRRPGLHRALPASGDRADQRRGLPRRLRRADLGAAEPEQGRLLSPHRHEG